MSWFLTTPLNNHLKEKTVNNIFVYCENHNGVVAEVSLELLTKGRSLANQLGCKLEAIVLGNNLGKVEKLLSKYGADVVHKGECECLEPYRTLPHSAIVCGVFSEEKPQIALMGATVIGRDLGPRVSSALHSGLTADCTSLEIGPHEDVKTKKVYENLLYQIRPAFGGNIIATIVNPDCRPQMATVREGVMKKEFVANPKPAEVKTIDPKKYITAEDLVVRIIERHLEKRDINIKDSGIIVAGGYGVGSPEGFALLHELAHAIGGEVGASRAAVDAGFAEHARQIGQTGVTVRPKLYIACGISGQIQHTAGMEESAMIISINNDPKAPINQIADYNICGKVEEVLPKMIKYYKENNK